MKEVPQESHNNKGGQPDQIRVIKNDSFMLLSIHQTIEFMYVCLRLSYEQHIVSG
jgi:hypothetical protein